MEVKDEIDSMLDVFEGKVKDEPEPEPEPTPEPEPKADPEPEPEPEPEPTSEPDEKDRIIEDLRSKLAEKEATPTKKEPDPEPIKEDPIKFEDHDFIGDTDPEDIIRDKDAFNKLLNSVYTKGVADAKKMSTESVLLSIPDIVKSNIEIISTLKETSDKFYAENEDLVPFKRVVATVFEDIAAQNPGKKYTELMGLVGDETRKRLNLQKQATQKKDNSPKLPSKGGNVGRSTSAKPDLSAMEAEIEAMNKILS